MKLSHAVDLYIQRERDAGMRFDSPTNILRSFLRHCVEAIALLALDDRTQHPVVQTSVEWLEHSDGGSRSRSGDLRSRSQGKAEPAA
jgi:hypothetical protein